MGPCESFGEMALIFSAPRSASVVAEQDTMLVRIERDAYDRVLRSSMLEAAEQRASFLGGLPLFSGFHVQHLVRFAEDAQAAQY